MIKKFLIILFLISPVIPAQNNSAFRIARLKYDGGGDWYNGQTEEINLLQFIGEHTNIKVKPDYIYVDIKSDDIFSYPFLFLTGHGNIIFNAEETENLRNYLISGGFLHISDNYGIDMAGYIEYGASPRASLCRKIFRSWISAILPPSLPGPGPTSKTIWRRCSRPRSMWGRCCRSGETRI